jgi:beta-mannosidase
MKPARRPAAPPRGVRASKSHPVKVVGAVLLVMVLESIAAPAADNLGRLLLSGTNWWIHEEVGGGGEQRGMSEAEVASPGWIPATVPGNIQADLEAARLIPPFWFESQDPRLAKPPSSGKPISWAEMWNRSDFTQPGGDPRFVDTARKNWWYRRDFTVPPAFQGQRAKLVFDGVDHECEVYLNGRKVGAHAGMYRRVGYDVGSLLRPGQVNQLAVRIARMPPSLEKHIGMPSQIKAYRHELSEIKAPSYGLDWGIGVYALGIWRDVWLEASGPARIEDVRVQTKLDPLRPRAQVIARLEVDSSEPMAVKARFRIEGHGANGSKEIGTVLATGSNQIEAVLELSQPALWWPNGQGDHPMYQLSCELLDRRGAILHRRGTRFGVREIRWVPVENAPQDASVLSQLVVNGRKVRLVGSNFIPVDLLPGRQHAKAEWLLRMVHQAGMNVVRNWGGVILRDEGYDLADDLGIMIQQEMPATNSGEAWPEEYAAYTAAMERAAMSLIKQLRNHPCLVEWTGGNEMGWPGDDSPVPAMLRKRVAEMDGRMFRVTDPVAGWAHGPYNATPSQFYRSYNGVPAARHDEFGAPGPAHLETWHRDIPPASQWPLQSDDPVLVVKNVFYGWIGDTWLQPRVIRGQFGLLPDLPTLIRAGQWISADELRYAMDGMRRGGLRTSGFMNWVFNEPWANGAGNTVVDYEGRPLMNYYLAKQALAPVSLSLKFDRLLYQPARGLQVEVWLTSDSPTPATGLSWQLRARDRQGRVFATEEGTASIDPLQAKALRALSLPIPRETAYGPILVETRLLDAAHKTLQERLQLFGCDLLETPFRGLMVGHPPAQEDDRDAVEPNSPTNLASVAQGAKPATASSTRPEPFHQPRGINDGKYGNEASWIPVLPKSSFHIELGATAAVNLFKLSRDRNGQFTDRWVDYLKIATSLDGSQWHTVFEQTGIKALPDFDPAGTMTVRTDPVPTRFVRVTVEAQSPATGEFPCIDEFEVFATGDLPGGAPRVSFARGGLNVWRSIKRTTIEVLPRSRPLRGGQDVLELTLTNSGPMTALFCEPHPLIDYRTDLFIENNHCFIPPGEKRTITIRASGAAGSGLTLAQTGWKVVGWNTGDVAIEPCPEVFLALGRRDRMCREFQGYRDPANVPAGTVVTLMGNRPEPSSLPYRLERGSLARFEFQLARSQARRAARLRLHTADQAEQGPTRVVATINGRPMEKALPSGLGVQRIYPAHLAFSSTLEFPVPAKNLRQGKNVLEVHLEGEGWFSWDALDLIAVSE